MTKEQLRAYYKEQRKKLSAKQIQNLSQHIAKRFQIYLQSKNAQIKNTQNGVLTIHIFHTIATQKEVNTQPIIDYLLSNNYKVVLPKMVENGQLQHIQINTDTLYETNALGITEPTEGLQIKPKEIDIVLLPLLAYDRNGNRVGYGKGFYDQFLSQCKKEVIKIGLSFFEPTKHLIESDPYDVPLTHFINPKEMQRY